VIARRIRMIAGCCFASLMVSGCATYPLPVYPDLPPQEAVKIVQSRLESVTSITAAGTLTLQSATRDVVRLDAVIVAAPPHRFRLKAWKLGRTAIDITVLEDGVWSIPIDSPSASPINVDGFRPVASALRPGCLAAATIAEHAADPSSILITSTECGIHCEIDRRTLTIRSVSTLSTSTGPRTLRFSDYQMVNQQPWPMTIKASSNAGEATLHFDTIEIDGLLPEEAFVPSSRAVRMP